MVLEPAAGPSASVEGPRRAIAATLLAAVIAAATLTWAKWMPYAVKIEDVSRSRTWSGASILAVGGIRPGDAPSWHAAITFAQSYVPAIWKALVAALLISSAVKTFLPRAWLLQVLNRGSRLSSATVAAVVSTPSMMCTCCAAPVAATLRRSGVSTAAVVAYWLGNPLLNPAALVFLMLVSPWQWTVTRVVVGAVLVIGGATLVAALAEHPAEGLGPAVTVAGTSSDRGPRQTPVAALLGFIRSLVRLSVVLVPEYLIVVLLVGAFRGWLFPLGSTTSTGVLVVLLAAVAGTLLVIPTAGEIPILQGLAIAGVSLGAVGALLITLPAVSLPGIAMVGRAFGWRATLATTVVVMIAGVLAGGLLTAL